MNCVTKVEVRAKGYEFLIPKNEGRIKRFRIGVLERNSDGVLDEEEG